MAKRTSIPPLLKQFPIVDPETGIPSLQFQRIWQDLFGNDTANADAVTAVAETADGAVPKSRLINTTSPLAGGGNLNADLTLTHNTSGVVAGPYTNANITVDDKGHVTAAANGSSGGATPWWWSPPPAATFSLISGDATSPVVTDDTDLGTVLTFGSNSVAGDIMRAAVETITTPSAAWSYQVRMSGTVWASNFCGVGIIIRNVANNRNVCVGLQQDLSVKLQRRTMTALNSNVSTFPGIGNEDFANVFFKVTYDGAANLRFYVSTDGKHWREAITFEPVGTYLLAAPDKIGFGIFTSNAGISDDLSLAVSRRVKSW